jgi:hypothetical protein
VYPNSTSPYGTLFLSLLSLASHASVFASSSSSASLPSLPSISVLIADKEFYVKWEKMSFAESTWETFDNVSLSAIENYYNRLTVRLSTLDRTKDKIKEKEKKKKQKDDVDVVVLEDDDDEEEEENDEEMKDLSNQPFVSSDFGKGKYKLRPYQEGLLFLFSSSVVLSLHSSSSLLTLLSLFVSLLLQMALIGWL